MSGTESLTTTRRRWRRYQVEIQVRVDISTNGENASFHSTGRDISQGGLSLFIPRDVAIGATISLLLCLPYSRENLRIRGVVRNRREFHYGIEFLDCNPIHRQIIAKNCRALELLE